MYLQPKTGGKYTGRLSNLDFTLYDPKVDWKPEGCASMKPMKIQAY